MKTYLDQDKNAILKEIGGGIEYYDVVIQFEIGEIYNIINNNNGIIDQQTFDDYRPLFKKANKALNVYLVLKENDNIVELLRGDILVNSTMEYAGQLIFNRVFFKDGQVFEHVVYKFEIIDDTYKVSVNEF